MAANLGNYDVAAAHRRAGPGTYAPPPDRRARADFADLRLGQLAAIPLREVQRLDSAIRDQLLARHTVRFAEQRRAERHELWARLGRTGRTARGSSVA